MVGLSMVTLVTKCIIKRQLGIRRIKIVNLSGAANLLGPAS